MTSADGEDRGTRPRSAVVAIAKNEGVYLHEWIAYHKLIGFDELLLYDNESTDGSDRLLAELEQQGMVTPIPWAVAPEVSPQTSAYIDGLARLGRDFGWVAFIDLDEFIVLPRARTIGEFLEGRPTQDALAINWRNFGSSGELQYRPEPVIDRFRRCADEHYGRNRRVKVLAHTSILRRPGVHSPRLEPGSRFVDLSGEPIADGRSTRPHLDEIRLNHYYTKSAEEWVWKAARGRGGKPSSVPDRKHWYPDFAARDVDGDEEVDVVRLLGPLRDLMDRTRPTTQPELPPAERIDAPPGAALAAQGPPPVVSPVPLGAVELAEVAGEAAPALAELGWTASRRARRRIDARGRPLPSFTYAATAFLESRPLDELRVFTYGDGDAAGWWAHRAAAVTAVRVEGARERTEPPSSVTVVVVPGTEDGPDRDVYTTAPRTAGGPFDVLTLDGALRVACARRGLAALSPSGVVVLENAERSKHLKAASTLTDAGFRRLDFAGLGPRLARVWQTAVFYRTDNCLGI